MRNETISTTQPTTTYICPVHGKIGVATIKFQTHSWESPTFCMKCLADLLVEHLPALELPKRDA